MMFSIPFYKIKYAGLIFVLMCVVYFTTGCTSGDEAMILIPSGEASEMNALEAAEREADIPAGSALQTEVTLPEPEQKTVYVYVCGAVVNPGVVELPEGSRAKEALQLAGGMTSEADSFYVNLAETVSDGQKLYFPTPEEAQKLEAAVQAVEEGLVNINTASAEELCTLPGIGTSRAEDILRYREKNGGFQSKEDIMKVSGIKQNAYDKLCDKITVQ